MKTIEAYQEKNGLQFRDGGSNKVEDSIRVT